MGLLNITVSTSIAILYNIFVHHMTSIMLKDATYEEKVNKSVVFILIAGIMGVVMSNILFDTGEKKGASVVSSGLWLGGILLIITAIFVNWQSLSDDIKLIMIGVTLVALIYYSKRTLEYEDEFENVNELDDLDKLDKAVKDEKR